MEERHTDSSDIEHILRDKHQELAALMQSIAAQEPDIDLKIASLVEGESEAVKLSIVQHIRDQLRAREDEQAKAMQHAMDAEQKQVMEAERKSLRRWLVWLMSETTLKKLRLAALIPLLREQGVKDIGQALAERGVTLNPSATNRRELGQLSQAIAQAKEPEKDGRGRN